MSNKHTGASYATVIGVKESLILIEFDDAVEVMKNEVGYICVGDERLKAEILRKLNGQRWAGFFAKTA